jgi:hypothetical protein
MDVPPEAVAIPKAPAVPSVAPAAAAPEAVASPAPSEEHKKESVKPEARAGSDRPASKAAPAPSKSGGTWEIVAFVLLAAAVVYALRG